MSHDDEAILIQAAQRGDTSAVGVLYERHVDAIFRYVNYRVPEESTADDLTAEVFLRMVESLPDYHQNGAPFEAWLYRIAAARVADFYREKTRHPQSELSDAEPDRTQSPESALQTREEQAELRAALAQLSDDHQTVLLLRFVERKSHSDVAAIIGKSETAVKSLQHRALTRLAELLGSDGKARHYLRGLDDD